MVLARWQGTIVDEAGNIVPGASVTVRSEGAGTPLANLFSDRSGLVAIGNPVTSDSEGAVAFHVVGGSYKITATKGSFTRTWRYVGVALGSEQDAVPVGIRYLFDDGITDADPGAGNFRLNHATPASATQVFISLTDADGFDETTFLDGIDDGGQTTERGFLIFRTNSSAGFLVARVTGSVTTATGYRKISITPLSFSAAGSFLDLSSCSMIFLRSGTNGQVSSTGTSTAGNIAVFTDATGDDIQDSGKSVTTVGAGPQTIWIPAGAITPRTTNGPGTSLVQTTTNLVMLNTLDFDPSTQEFAQFNIKMPKGWNEGTITFQAVWYHPATATNFGVAWALQAFAFSDDDAADQAFGTEQVVTDTGGTTNDIYITAESAAITIGGTPAEGDWVVFQIKRVPANGSDTMAVDARLLGVKLIYTTNVNTDA